MIVGVCLPTYACDAQCKHLDSSGLTALPFKMEVNSCNSTCCDTDLCNKYGSGNITVPGKVFGDNGLCCAFLRLFENLKIRVFEKNEKLTTLCHVKCYHVMPEVDGCREKKILGYLTFFLYG